MESNSVVDPIQLAKGSTPTLRNKFDALALLLHAIIKSKGFLYYGSGDSNDDTGNSYLAKCSIVY